MAAPSLVIVPHQLDGILQPWTRDEYYRAGELEIFGPDERLYLVDGIIPRRQTSPSPNHVSSVYMAAHVLEEVFGPGFYVDRHWPLTVSEESEPVPDVLAAARSVHDYEDRHPRSEECLIVVEVSDTTIDYDRGTKARLYGSAGISEYWIVNIGARRLEGMRDPTPDWGYRTETVHGPPETISPLASTGASVCVSSLMPRKP